MTMVEMETPVDSIKSLKSLNDALRIVTASVNVVMFRAHHFLREQRSVALQLSSFDASPVSSTLNECAGQDMLFAARTPLVADSLHYPLGRFLCLTLANDSALDNNYLHVDRCLALPLPRLIPHIQRA